MIVALENTQHRLMTITKSYVYFGGLISMKEQITKEKKSVITVEEKEISLFL